MAVKGPIPVHFEQVFPHGAWITSEVTPVYEFSNGQRGPQARHKVTNELMWEVTVHDADPDARGAAKSVKVKIASDVQPVPPPPMPGTPFAAVEFEELAITPYVVQAVGGRARIAYSIQARGMSAPKTLAEVKAGKATAGV